jgi:RNA-directed DNA polymerase
MCEEGEGAPLTSDLTSLANLHAAFARVEASRGMAGVDGVTVAAFRQGLEVNLALLAEELDTGRYSPLPLIRLLVAKPDGSPRALSVPAVRDRVAQAAVLRLVEPIFEAQFEDVSFAYRKGRSVKQAAYRVKELRDQGYRFVVDADLDAFFDNIDHELLLAKVSHIIADSAIVNLIRLWVRAEIYDGERVYRLEKGIPQGAVISPALANLFLDELDEALISRGHQLVRYGDDFVILARSRPEAEAAMEFTEEILAQMHLALDAEDTGISDFAKGFTYLGLIFLGEAILAPFDRPKRPKKVLYMPPPFDLADYLSRKLSC